MVIMGHHPPKKNTLFRTLDISCRGNGIPDIYITSKYGYLIPSGNDEKNSTNKTVDVHPKKLTYSHKKDYFSRKIHVPTSNH